MPPNSRTVCRSISNVCAAPSVRVLRHIVPVLPSIASAASLPLAAEEARAVGGGTERAGRSGFKDKRSNHKLPCPPSSPALSTNSIDWNWRSVRVGRRAPRESRSGRPLDPTCCQSPENW
jgi:hypothetical protein